MEEIEISSAKLCEIEDVLKLKDEVWLDTYVSKEHGITEADLRSREALNSERLMRMQRIVLSNSSDGHIWVVKFKNEIVGMCSAEKGDDKNKLVSLYVLPKYQGLGIGTRLFEKVLDWFGCDKPIELGVAEYNAKAIRFYEKFGFEIEGNMEDYTLASGKRIPLVKMKEVF